MSLFKMNKECWGCLLCWCECFQFHTFSASQWSDAWCLHILEEADKNTSHLETLVSTLMILTKCLHDNRVKMSGNNSFPHVCGCLFQGSSPNIKRACILNTQKQNCHLWDLGHRLCLCDWKHTSVHRSELQKGFGFVQFSPDADLPAISFWMSLILLFCCVNTPIGNKFYGSIFFAFARFWSNSVSSVTHITEKSGHRCFWAMGCLWNSAKTSQHGLFQKQQNGTVYNTLMGSQGLSVSDETFSVITADRVGFYYFHLISPFIPFSTTYAILPFSHPGRHRREDGLTVTMYYCGILSCSFHLK